ncbi:MAG: precorrin-8X methylmutase [Pseudomonadota bacterium]
MRPYERDPQAIYAASFATVRAEANLARFPPDIAELAIRIIHACGMVEVADRLAFSTDLAEEGRTALTQGAPIYTDCEMVASGLTRRLFPSAPDIRCTLNDPRTADLAQDLGTTRSAAAVDLWKTGGAIIAIGNAPTALFHLLERLDDGAPTPAAILAFPVGFVGAAESKAELAANPRSTPFLTLRGRRGGSAMASAAVNALALLAAGGVQ